MFNARAPLMTEIMMSFVLFLIGLLAMAGIMFKVIGSVVQFIAAILCYIFELVDRIKYKRTKQITVDPDE
jgi:Tfp pilus assembly protein PilV